ncbi:MAG TPA: nitroreductase family deazaflavin-dependent oxidoreductase [Nocardioidaceae bacterium]|nr:nitroreductase family deazaflavin-dependent oxidoreductase [Nocardioidaceae bacterium]
MAKTYRLNLPTRLANGMMRSLLAAGLGPGFLRLLTVTGRKTGKERTTPVAPLETSEGRWLVAPFGEVGWVRNIRAHNHALLRRGRHVEHIEVEEVPPAESVSVLRSYLRLKPQGKFVQAYFDVTPDSSDEDIVAEAPRHPAFRIVSSTPAGEGG